MGCDEASHIHRWPTQGNLVIERCEVYCDFCEGPARQKRWKFAWFLRRHVRAVHIKSGQYPFLRCGDDWHSNHGNTKQQQLKRSFSTTPQFKLEPVPQYPLPAFYPNHYHHVDFAPYTTFTAPTFSIMPGLGYNNMSLLESYDPNFATTDNALDFDDYLAIPDSDSDTGFVDDQSVHSDHTATHSVVGDDIADTNAADLLIDPSYADIGFFDDQSVHSAHTAIHSVGSDHTADTDVTSMPTNEADVHFNAHENVWSDLVARETQPKEQEHEEEFIQYLSEGLKKFETHGMSKSEVLWCLGEFARTVAEQIEV